ncbi:MAG: branched-chain amino acid ABC transporter permease [Chloroflexi bacterium]|nr:branched-chain amino acid ABC transporter permease [Chloroflexota bacterium]MDA8187039.1 branched-chain amino acid ABC transporter permease [Dehalococcoidales bacterium]
MLQQLVNALLLGGIYALVGVGFSLIYGVMNIINLAHGALIMLAAYTTFWVFQLYGVDPFASIVISMALFFVIGFILQKYIVNRVVGQNVLMTMVLTYGFELIAVNFALYFWHADYRAVNPTYAGTGLEIGDVVVPYIKLGILTVAIVLTSLLYLFMTRTKIGNAIQATSLNKDAAQLVGIDIQYIYSFTYGLSAALAAAAGTLIAIVYTVTPSMEGGFLGKAFVIAILGGLGNSLGAIVGGVVLALAETFGVVVFGAAYQQIVGYVIFLLVLIVRPCGLVGRRFFSEL